MKKDGYFSKIEDWKSNCTTKKMDNFEGEVVCILPNSIKDKFRITTLCQNLFFTAIGFYPKASNHFRERDKGAEEFIFIYCQDGEGWFQIENDKFEVAPGQYFILPAKKPHSYGTNPQSPWSIYWVHFSGHLASYYCHFLLDSPIQKPHSALPSLERCQLFHIIVKHGSLFENFDSLIYANNCLYKYLVSFKSSTSIEPIDEKPQEIKILNDCVDLMNSKIHENLNLTEISRIQGVSVSYLSMIFKKIKHDTPYNYFIQLKMQRACYLLWNSNEKIKTIAFNLGFDDQYHFSRLFKNKMGLSPRQFRNRNK